MGGRRIIWLVVPIATLELLLWRFWLFVIVGGDERLLMDERLEVEKDKLVAKDALSDESAFDVKADVFLLLLPRLTANTLTDMADEEAAIIWFGVT
jgi:hypothetical protein